MSEITRVFALEEDRTRYAVTGDESIVTAIARALADADDEWEKRSDAARWKPERVDNIDGSEEQ